MKFFRNKKGYYFQLKNAFLGYVIGNETYYVIIKEVVLNREWLIYKAKEKPKFRNLCVLSIIGYLFSFLISPIVIPIFLSIIIFYYVGKIFFILGRLMKSLGYLFMLMPHSAKRELKELFVVYAVGKAGLKDILW